MKETEYYDRYEQRLQDEMVKLCTSHGLMKGQLLAAEDFEEKWKELAPEYMADSVGQINSYPAAAIAWAGYLGMAVANRWDSDWSRYNNESYSSLRGEEGFDDMDEHIIHDILGLDIASSEAVTIENILRSAAHLAMNMIKNEEIEPQSTDAFYIFARTERVMFRIGVSLELTRLGYKYEKLDLSSLYEDGKVS